MFVIVGFVTLDSGPHKIIDKIFVNTRYFVMKSNNYDNVDIAKAKVLENIVACLLGIIKTGQIIIITGIWN